MKNLLILGAGGYGRTVAETARAAGFSGKIAFLDDGGAAPGILGKCAAYPEFTPEFQYAYPAFGTNALRAEWMARLERAGYRIPVLVHPHAYVSPSAVLEQGAVVLPMAAVGTNTTLKKGVIVNMGAIVDHDCVLGECVHLAPGAVVKAGNLVPEMEKVESGAVLERGTAFPPLGGKNG